MIGVLVIPAIAVLLSANAFWWWHRDRRQAEEIRVLKERIGAAKAGRDHWRERARAAEAAVAAAEPRKAAERVDITSLLAKRMRDRT